jgi:nucleotide-binding universal stress UspA family protein
MDEELEEARTIVNKVVNAAQAAGVSAEGITPRGKAYNTLVETTEGRAVDLIVIGIYGKIGLREFLMGSTTEIVVALAGCAVMVAKRG